MRRFLAAAVLSAVAASVGATPTFAKAQTTPTAPLDGTAWSVTVAPDGFSGSSDEKPFEDSLTFVGGTIHSTAFTKYGFAGVSYTAKVGPQISFKARKEATKDQGKMVWEGDVNGERIKGTINWMRKDGTFVRYRFQGRKVAKPSTP